jgi:hypothetical protein
LNARLDLHRRRRGRAGDLWRLRCAAEAHLMLANIIWGAGALVIGGYMIVALLRPEKF